MTLVGLSGGSTVGKETYSAVEPAAPTDLSEFRIREGTADRNTISTGQANDFITGLAGSDVIESEHGDDWVDGGSGNDEIESGRGNDTILGGIGNDTLEGRSNDDYIHGGRDDDYIDGGSGNDTLVGGDGADTFEFWFSEEPGNDVVVDFTPSEDSLRIGKLPEHVVLVDLENGVLMGYAPEGPTGAQDHPDSYRATVYFQGMTIAELTQAPIETVDMGMW